MEKTIVVLDSEDCYVLSGILGEEYRVIGVQNIPQMRGAVRNAGSPVMMCEARTAAGNWRDALEIAQAEGAPLIVCNRLADEHLWVEVLNEGGYDVLAKPFVREEVWRVVESAARAARKVMHA